MNGTPLARGDRVAVLGAGIVGSACAAELAAAGLKVTLLDREEPGSQTSWGNTGVVLNSRIEPLSDWRLLKSLPLMMLRKDTAVMVRRRHLPALRPWLTNYAKALLPQAVAQGRLALATLNRQGWEAWTDLAGRAGIPKMVRQTGVVVCYSTKAGWEGAAGTWAKKQEEFGINYRVLAATDLVEMVPAFAHAIHTGVLATADGMVADPKQVVDALVAHAAASGVEVRRDEVQAVAQVGEVVRVATASGTSEHAAVVVALGPWSHKVAASCGDQVPLDVQRGYSHTFPAPQVKVRYPAVIEDRGLTVLPMDDGGLRLGGWVEFDDMDAPPTPEVHARLAATAKELMPELDATGAIEWMGCRPALPDSLPVIGPSPRQPRVCYAFGHGHLGVTQAAITARAVTAIVTGAQSPVPAEMFSAGRFAG